MSKYDNERGVVNTAPTTASGSKYQSERDMFKAQATPLSSNQIHALEQEQSDMAQMAEASRISSQKAYNDRALAQEQSDMEQMDTASKYASERAQTPLPGRDVPVIGPVLKAADALADNPIRQKAADIFQTIYTPGAGAANVAGYVGSVGAGLSRLAPNLGKTFGGKVVETAIKEAAVGAPLGAGQSLAQGNQFDDALTHGALTGAALGGALGAAGPVVGKAVNAASNAAGKGLAQGIERPSLGSAVDDFIKRVNESNATPSSERLVQNVPTRVNPILNEAADNFARREAPTKARLETRSNQYAQKLDELFQTARQEGLPPGREREALDDMWSRMAGPEDPNLDQLIELATPSLKELERRTPTRDMLAKAKETQRIREVAGVPLPVKSEADRFSTSSKYQNERNQTQLEVMPQTPRSSLVEQKSVEPVASSPIIENTTTKAASPQQQRGFTETLLASEKTPQGLKERLNAAYTQIPNEVSVGRANKRINDDIEAASSYVMGKSPTSAEKVATAHRLIDEFSKLKNYERANDIADKIAAELTKAGQSVQAASIYNRLTPEGILVHANRIAQRVNEKLPITAKEVKVTPEMAANLTDLAQTTQRMTSVKGLADDVMNILDKAKSGEKLTDTEASTLRNFVNESKQFIKETTRKTRDPNAPKPPVQPRDKRVRDNVVNFLDAQEQAAKERLRARGIQISSTPLDVWADYAVIGAAKMGKGAIKFADWSEQMVKELGEDIRPYLNNLYERSKEAFEQSTKVVSKQTISQAEKLTESVIKSKKLGPEEAKSLRSLAKNVSKLSGEEKRIASQDLQAILQTLSRSTFLKKVSTTQTIGQLLNPKTQVRNVLGNELFYRIERLNKLLATPIDVIRSNITGGERTVTFKTNNQGEFWLNFMRGAKAGWKGVNINGLQTQFDLASPAFTGKYNPLTYMEKSLGAALRSFDNAAYMRAYNNTVGELATLRAINEGKAGDKDLIQKYIREADDNVLKIADEYGKYVTFQDNNVLSTGLQKLKKGMNFGKDFGIGDLVLKYPKTPGSLLMRALEYSPAGFIRSASILAKPWFKKEPNTAEVTQALSRATIGTFGLSGLGYYLMDKGILTGDASKDKDIRDLQKSAGQGQYQVNLSALKRFVQSGFDPSASKIKEGDMLYTYDWMQPVSMAVSIGANISKNMSEGKQKLSGLAGTAYNSVEGGLGTLTEQSVLQGLKQAAQGYPGQTVTDKILDILSDIPSSFVPTYLNQVKQMTDNQKRETYSPNKFEQSINKAQAKVPGLSENLPQQYDTLGKPKQTYQNNNAFNVLLNPGFTSNYELSPEAKMVVDLIDDTKDETLAPRVPGKTINIDGQSVKLTGDQFSKYQQLQGEATANNIIKRYNPNASEKSRTKTMQKILNDSGEKAREKLKKELKLGSR